MRDCGTNSTDAVDYPDFAHAVAPARRGRRACRWGIVVDGAGIGSCMAANKVPGRPGRHLLGRDLGAATAASTTTRTSSSSAPGLARRAASRWQIVDAWLATPWGGDRHARRVEKITEIERRYLPPASGVAA